MCIVEIFGDIQHFLWTTSVQNGDIALDLIFHKESFGDVSESVGLGGWLL